MENVQQQLFPVTMYIAILFAIFLTITITIIFFPNFIISLHRLPPFISALHYATIRKISLILILYKYEKCSIPGWKR